MIKTDIWKKFAKNKHNLYICVIFIIGLVLMTAGVSDKSKKTEKRGAADDTVIRNEEKRLESIISDIKGVGDVTVMITYSSGAGKELAYETRTNRSERSTDVTENIDKQAVVTSGEPVVLREVSPEVKGVIVTAGGAADPRIKAAVSEAVCAALGVPAHRVCVFEKK